VHHHISKSPSPKTATPSATLQHVWSNVYRRDELSPHLLFSVQGWHEIKGRSFFDAELFQADHRQYLIHSGSNETDPHPTPIRLSTHHLYFQLPDNVLVALFCDSRNGSRLVLWAPDFDQARVVYQSLRTRYAVAPKRKPVAPVFYVLRSVGRDVGVQPIPVPRQYQQLWRRRKSTGGTYTAAEWLALHYGREFPVWHQQFATDLRARTSGGLTLLRGEPGTGKSTYLRFLLADLGKTHRFYYLPTNAFDLLTSPSMADFWLEEGNDHPGRGGRVVILEDAERLLMERSADKQDRLSNLLNLADGFLGDALQLHVICTVNCPLERIDPALLRPGRLTASYAFSRLTQADAKALANAEGFDLPAVTHEDRMYSLADLYTTPTVSSATPALPRRVGFKP
jgi:hypothetical protein